MAGTSPSRRQAGAARPSLLPSLIAVFLAVFLAYVPWTGGDAPPADGNEALADPAEQADNAAESPVYGAADAATRREAPRPDPSAGMRRPRFTEEGSPDAPADGEQRPGPPAAPVLAEPSLPRAVLEDETAIAGRVLDATGMPVDGARLDLRARSYFDPLTPSPSGHDSWTTTSDVRGFYAFPYLEPGLYRVRAVSPFDRANASREVRTGVHSADLILGRSDERRIEGRVSGSHGEPLYDVLVFQGDRPAQATVTDADGRFMLSLAFATGSHGASLRFAHEDFRERRIFVDGAQLAGEQPTVVDVALEPLRPHGVVRGTLVSIYGEPVVGERVQLVSAELARAFHDRTDSAGRFALAGVPTNSAYSVLVQPEGPWEDYSHRDLRVPEGGLELLIELQSRETGAVTGIVVDTAGRPLPGFDLSVRSARSSRAFRSVTADPSGHFFVDDVPAGDLLFESLAYPSLTVRGVHLRPGTLEEVRLTLDWGNHRVNGQVVDVAGQPVPGSRIWLTMDVRAHGVSSRSTRRTTADAQGFFGFTGVGPGPHQVRVDAPGFRPSVIDHDVQAAVERVHVVMK